MRTELLTHNPTSWSYQHNLAQYYFTTRDYQKAAEMTVKLIDLAPYTSRSWGELGRCYSELKQKDKAIAAMRQAIILDTDNSFYHCSLGYLLSGPPQQNLEEALVEFSRSIELDPGDRYAIASLGACYRRLGNQTRYQEQVAIAGKVPPSSEDEYTGATIEALCGNTPEAIRLLKIALEKKLRSPGFVRNDTDFDFICNEPGFKSLIA